MADSSRVLQLMLGQLLRGLSPEDNTELEDWTNESPDNRKFMESRVRPEIMAGHLKILSEMNVASLDKKVSDLIAADARRKIRKKAGILTLNGAIAIAALLLVIFKPAWLGQTKLSFSISRSTPEMKSRFQETARKVQRPQIILSPDLVLYLDTLHLNWPYRVGHFNIVKIDSQQIAYLRRDATTTDDPDDSVYHTISIPEGTTGWQASLPDGSYADFSPGSSLSFLVHLSGSPLKNRVLVLNGEVIFNIAHNNNGPFILETKRGEMQDVGTVFSVRDYGKEDTSGILTYSGSLTVNNGRQLATLDSAHRATIKDASPDITVAPVYSLPKPQPWQHAMFDFSHQSVLGAVRQLAAWYGGYHIYYNNDIDTITLGKLGEGHVSKDFSASLPDLLKAMETSDIHFNVSKHEIYIHR